MTNPLLERALAVTNRAAIQNAIAEAWSDFAIRQRLDDNLRVSASVRPDKTLRLELVVAVPPQDVPFSYEFPSPPLTPLQLALEQRFGFTFAAIAATVRLALYAIDGLGPLGAPERDDPKTGEVLEAEELRDDPRRTSSSSRSSSGRVPTPRRRTGPLSSTARFVRSSRRCRSASATTCARSSPVS